MILPLPGQAGRSLAASRRVICNTMGLPSLHGTETILHDGRSILMVGCLLSSFNQLTSFHYTRSSLFSNTQSLFIECRSIRPQKRAETSPWPKEGLLSCRFQNCDPSRRYATTCETSMGRRGNHHYYIDVRKLIIFYRELFGKVQSVSSQRF